MRPQVFIVSRKIFGRFTGITLYPFIVISRESPDLNKTFRHELIHWIQFKELYVFGFYALYLWYWIRYGSYGKIPFERECYDNDDQHYYVEFREPFAWRKYLKKNE